MTSSDLCLNFIRARPWIDSLEVLPSDTDEDNGRNGK